MAITDEEILDYLEHHGVKGMRWGSRKASSIVNTVNSNAIKNVQRVQKERDASRARDPKAFKRKETAKKVAIAGAIVAPLVVRAILKQRGKTKFKNAQLAAHARSSQFTIYNMIQSEKSGGAGAFKESFGELKNMQKHQNWSDSQFSDYLSRRFFAVSSLGGKAGVRVHG